MNKGIGVEMRCEQLIPYLRERIKEGWFKEYSPDHFLMKTVRGELPSFFKNHPEVTKNCNLPYGPGSIADNFLINFSARLSILEKVFGKKAIETFVRGQLAAGKRAYNEDQFFQAFSEVILLSYLPNYARSKVIKALYEPKLRDGRKNPEAQFEFQDGTVLNVEVKTPSFPRKIELPKDKKGVLKPNTYLNKIEQRRLLEICADLDVDLFFPRILKIKDYISSASKKFPKVDHINEFNLLCINWTMSEYYNEGVGEAVGVIGNSSSGILFNKRIQKNLKITKDDMSRISAVLIYRDSLDSISMCDFRWHFAGPGRIFLVFTDNVNKRDYWKLERKLNTNHFDPNRNSWQLFDWAYRKDDSNGLAAVERAKEKSFIYLQKEWAKKNIVLI